MSADISMKYDQCENCDSAGTCHITGCKWDTSPIITDKEEDTEEEE